MTLPSVPGVSMETTIRSAFLAGCAALLPLFAVAAEPSPSPNVYRSLESGSARDAGEVRGTIADVDYAGGSISVRERSRLLTVAVVPSTAIYRGHQYATLSDLRRGETVDAEVYTINGRLVARTIQLR
jgi:hypothetical protein